jgi:hypothetical protein
MFPMMRSSSASHGVISISTTSPFALCREELHSSLRSRCVCVLTKREIVCLIKKENCYYFTNMLYSISFFGDCALFLYHQPTLFLKIQLNNTYAHLYNTCPLYRKYMYMTKKRLDFTRLMLKP